MGTPAKQVIAKEAEAWTPLSPEAVPVVPGGNSAPPSAVKLMPYGNVWNEERDAARVRVLNNIKSWDPKGLKQTASVSAPADKGTTAPLTPMKMNPSTVTPVGENKSTAIPFNATTPGNGGFRNRKTKRMQRQRGGWTWSSTKSMNKQNNLPDSVRIFMRSINVDGKPQDTDILKDNDAKLTEKIDQPDICVVMSQEDYRSGYSPSLLPDRFKLPNSITKSLNPNPTEQNIKLEVQYNDTVAPNKSETGVISVAPKKGTKGAIVASGQKFLSIIPGSGLGLTKGAVWCKLIYADCNIVFVSMHLPVDTKSDNLGNTYRIESLQYILTELKNKNIIDNNSYAFFGGDLNFRMLQSDQMGPAIQEIVKNPAFAKLSEISNITGDKTCRLVKEGPCSDNVGRASDPNCFTSDRDPSYCDRFLALPPDNGDRDFLAHSFFPSHLIKTSDHNAVSIGVDLIKKFTIERGGENIQPEEATRMEQQEVVRTPEKITTSSVVPWQSTRTANRRTSLLGRVTSPMVETARPLAKVNLTTRRSSFSPMPPRTSGGKRTRKAKKSRKTKKVTRSRKTKNQHYRQT